MVHLEVHHNVEIQKDNKEKEERRILKIIIVNMKMMMDHNLMIVNLYILNISALKKEFNNNARNK